MPGRDLRELLSSEQRLRAIYDGVYEYIGFLAPDGTLLDANRASLEFGGTMLEDVVGRPFWELVWWANTPGAADRLREAVTRAAAGETFRAEWPLRRPSGEVVIFDFSLRPVRDEQGDVVLIIPEGRDINPRHKKQEMKLLHHNAEESAGTSWRELLRPGLRGALIAGVGLAIFQQLVGPNTVLFYTPTIFGYAGVTGNPLLPTIYVGAVLFVFVFPTIAFVDVAGRKALFYLGLGGMGSMLVLLGLAFHFGATSWGAWVLIILLVYVGCYSLSISPLFWLMSAEVFPNRLRAAGASAATVANWGANLLVSVTFLSLINAVGKAWTFWIYAIFAALAVVFVWRFVPETKGRPLEHIDRYWTQGHRWPGSRAA